MTDVGCLTLEPLFDCSPVAVQSSRDSWGVGIQTVVNPCAGSGNTVLFIAVGPGPGLEPSNSWTAPVGATQIYDYEVTNPNAQFVQRVRMWVGDDTGQASYQFGFNSSTFPQSAAVVCLTEKASVVGVAQENVDSTTTTFYPPVSSVPGELVLAVATGQNADVLLQGPSGWPQVLNNTTVGSNRVVAVHSNTAIASTTTLGASLWSGSTAAHVMTAVSFECREVGSGGGGSGIACEKIDPSRLRVNIDPSDPGSDWGTSRTDGQWLVGGDRINAGSNCGNILSPPLCWDAAGTEIDGPFVLENGQSRVLWTAPAVDGVPSLWGVAQYVKDGSYLSPAVAPPHGYVDSPPSHVLFFDGTRNEISYIGTEVRTGPGCDPVKYATSFIVEEWMYANDNTGAIHGIHVPINQGGSGPMGTHIKSGQLSIRSQWSPTAVPTVPNTNSVSTGITLGTMNLPPVGQRVTLVYDYCIDPSGGGYFRLYRLDGDSCNLVISHNHEYGIYFADSTLTGKFYPQMLIIYAYHQFDAGVASENWDDSGPWNNARELSTAFSAFTSDPTCTVEDMCGHAKTFVGGDC